MSEGWGNLGHARDLRQVLRLDDLRKMTEDAPLVEAVVMTTHDLNLRFVLTELLPGYLVSPDQIPPGLGPGHRSYRAPMVELPHTAIVFAPEASVDCATPWRPPSLDVVAYRGVRRLHAKVSAVLYRHGGIQFLRLVVSSANLTRRAFAANLEVAVTHDFEVGPGTRKYPALFELGQLLDSLVADSSLGLSRALAMIRSALPDSRGHRKDGEPDMCTSVTPSQFSGSIARWLADTAYSDENYDRALVVSPFFSPEGGHLEQWVRKDVGIEEDWGTIDLVLDGRQTGSESTVRDGEPFTTPPPWLRNMRAEDSATYRPAVVARRRGTDALVGTGAVGRPLHAKVIGTAWWTPGKRKPRRSWRLAIGSANFTESGLGLAGEGSNLEAVALVEHEEPADEHARALETQPHEGALCVPMALEACPESRAGADLVEEQRANATGKAGLTLLDGAKIQVEQSAEGFTVTVELLEPLPAGASLRFGRDGPEFTAERERRYAATVPSLAPLFIAVVIGERSFAWPLPASLPSVESVLMAQAAGRRRVDRLLDYWLGVGSGSVEGDEDELEASLPIATPATSNEEATVELGSWRLNRLALGLRRRLAAAGTPGYPPFPGIEALLGSVRVRELLDLAVKLPVADRLYFGVVVHAALLGYAARHAGTKRTFSFVEAKSLAEAWNEGRWEDFVRSLDEARVTLGEAHVKEIEALDPAAAAVFVSVREQEVA